MRYFFIDVFPDVSFEVITRCILAIFLCCTHVPLEQVPNRSVLVVESAVKGEVIDPVTPSCFP